ncbi:hypothetical protein [Ktedonospora formicarum]|uniref:Uncharacterized protein n=1 Tax=Ktedonospora formicarum TaxID=2778364 RepID=A0A8J3I1A5_9CHLR|nr:hypothetical protein [Ktedonospora formicarum]GHO48182.1 hypothetical protein KSX_63450 [Ktedonospora formicarum]
MFVANPARAIKGTINGIITAFVSGPRRVFLYAALWVLMGASCGLIGLGNTLGFFNVVTGFFFIVAGLLLVLAVVKYILWRRNGLRETLPDGTVLVAIAHNDAQPGSSYAPPGSRNSYVLPIAPVATASEPVTLLCPTCQKELNFQVASLQARKSRRLNLLLIALITFLIGLAINVFFSPLFPLASQGWVFWVRLVGYVFLFICGIYISGFFQYTGVSAGKLPLYHYMQPVLSANLEAYREQQKANAYGQSQF